MKALIIKHIDVEGPGLIGEWLRQERISYSILDLTPGIQFPKVDDLSHIVLLGGPMNVYEEGSYPFLREEDLFIKEAIQRGKQVLGICLGAQLISKALGAKVYRAPAKEIGWYDVSLTEEGSRDPLFSIFPETFPVFQWHEDTFDIPKAARLIVTSPSIPHQAFRYGENAYGLQFHLEVTKEMIREWMETDEEEVMANGSQHPSSSKEEILGDTDRKMEAYRRQGMIFITNFFKRNSMFQIRK